MNNYNPMNNYMFELERINRDVSKNKKLAEKMTKEKEKIEDNKEKKEKP